MEVEVEVEVDEVVRASMAVAAPDAAAEHAGSRAPFISLHRLTCQPGQHAYYL